MDLMLIDLLESSKAIGLCPMGMQNYTACKELKDFIIRSGMLLGKSFIHLIYFYLISMLYNSLNLLSLKVIPKICSRWHIQIQLLP